MAWSCAYGLLACALRTPVEYRPARLGNKGSHNPRWYYRKSLFIAGPLRYRVIRSKTRMEVFLVDTARILWLIWYEVTRMRLHVKYEFMIAVIISLAAYFPLHGQNLSLVPSSGSDGQYDQVIPVNDSTSGPGTSQAQAPPSTLPTPGNTTPQNSN